MWVFDVETLRFLAVNEAAVHKYGYSADEFLSLTIEDIRPEADVPLLREIVAPEENTERANLSLARQWRHRLKDGTSIDVEVTSHTHEFEGRAARVVLAFDISDRVRGEAALRESEVRYRELFENAHRSDRDD